MYYSSGNYEAFATPEKPEGIEKKSAYIVGTGLGGLAAAIFLIRDAQMPGDHITLFEHLPLAGGRVARAGRSGLPHRPLIALLSDAPAAPQPHAAACSGCSPTGTARDTGGSAFRFRG